MVASTQTCESPSAFDWLRGYEACRTGWDRFRKPQTNTTSQEVEIGQGFPGIALSLEQGLALVAPHYYPFVVLL